MKKLLLILTFLLITFFVNAQCTPNPSYTLPGIYPDSATGLVDAYVGQAYNEVITIITPLDTTILITGILFPVTIIDISLDSVIGLPANFTYSCTPLNCSFPGGSSGCVSVFSTSNPTVADIGLYPIIINTTTTVDAGLFGILTQNDIIDYYYIEIFAVAIYGCTDPLAINYDPTATIDDSSCVYCNLTVTSSTTNVTCNGMCNGTATITPTGGCTPYTYFWDNGNVYYSVTDSTATAINLCAGTHTYTVTDCNGCVVNNTFMITEPLPLISYDTLSVTTSLTWNNMTLTVSGDYSVTLTNAAGCDSIANLNLTITIPSGILNVTNTEETLLKITDMLGQETPYKRNTPLFYIYDNGTVEKRIVIE